jgi:acyl-CoA synthetase (NDP forming)
MAVIGASASSFVGRVAVENCHQLGFAGDVTPVSRRHPYVAGVQTAPSVREMSHVPDLALVQVATPRVLGLVQEAIDAGVRNFIVPGGGFTDSGDDAVKLVEGLRQLGRVHDINVVGPNCMGVLDLVTGAAPYIGTVPEQVRRGSVGVVSQSGAVVELVVNSGGRIPLSTLVSAGSESTTGLADYLDFFCEDPETTAVLAFIEGFHDPTGFLDSARRFIASGKHVAATIVGRSATSREGVQAHSGKLAPSARVTVAALRQVGVFLADDLDELLAFGEIFGCGIIPRGNRVHFVTNSGGEGNLLADLADDAGLELPPMSAAAVSELTTRWPRFLVRNPLDPWGVDDYERVYPAVVAAAAREDGDILVISQDQQQTSGEHERTLGLDLARYLQTEQRDGVVSVFLSPTSQDPDPQITAFCREHAIAHLRGARPALSALGKLACQPAVSQTRPVLEPVESSRLADGATFTEYEALGLLGSLGVPIPRQIRVLTPEDAVRAAAQIHGPVVVKGLAENLVHKSDLGLVAVGLHGPDAVRSAAEAILGTGDRAGLNLELLVAEMASGSLDIYVGFKRDAQFGNTLVLGLGGVWTEHLDQVDIYVGLLDQSGAERWIPTTRSGQMLAAGRGGALPAHDIVAALAAISRLAQHDASIVAIDINPMMCSKSGGVAVDAVIQRTTDDNPQEKAHD